MGLVGLYKELQEYAELRECVGLLQRGLIGLVGSYEELQEYVGL